MASEEATAAYEAARARLADFIGAGSPEELVLVRNATEAINLVAYTWGRANVGPGDHLVVTELEHHSNLVPWQRLAAEREACLDVVPIDDAGREEDVQQLLEGLEDVARVFELARS